MLHAPAAVVSCGCCHGCRPPAGGGANEKEDPGVHNILLHPLHPDQLFVSNQSSTCYLMNMNGQVIKALQSGKRQGGGEAGGTRPDFFRSGRGLPAWALLLFVNL
jgi:hypothetical protein